MAFYIGLENKCIFLKIGVYIERIHPYIKIINKGGMDMTKWKEGANETLQAACLVLSHLRIGLVNNADTPEETNETRGKIFEIEDQINNLRRELDEV